MGIFDTPDNTTFAKYNVRLQVRDRIVGGIPKDPKVIEGWLRTKAEIDGVEELKQAVVRTAQEIGIDLPEYMTYEESSAALEKITGEKNTNGFKKDENGLYIEGRQVKAMLKESTHILFSGERWARGLKVKGGKGPKAYVAERVFVNPDRIYLGVMEPTAIELSIGHPTGPQGTQSTLTYLEYVERPALVFEVMVLRDEMPNGTWPEIWKHAQENGIGAKRSTGVGRFDIEQFERIGS